MPVALVGLAVSAYSAYNQNKQAKEAKDSRDEALAREEGVAAEDKAYWRKKYGPVNDMLIDYVMGNKPNAALAQGLTNLEDSYGVAKRRMDEIQARRGLGQEGIGEGQEIGLGLSEAKAKAALTLQDQAERYRVGQALGMQEGREQVGMQGQLQAYGAQAKYGQLDYQDETARTSQLWGQAGKSLSAGADYMYGTKPKPDQIDTIEHPVDTSDANFMK